MPRSNETKVPAKMIEKIARRHLEGQESAAALAKELKVTKGTVYNWVARWRKSVVEDSKKAGVAPAVLDKAEKMTLRAENAELKLENARLRNKLIALMIKSGEL